MGDVVQFRVLGPLQVVAGDCDEPVTVSAARLRALLAVLLWRANQPVPTDELAELVWDGAPPGGVADALRTLVMRLRRQLGERAAARIVTHPAGYLIEISADELDASRFEALAREAGAAVCAGQWAQAAVAAAQALGLWRGAPLADVPSQLLRERWVPRLEQLQVQALDWRIEADLREGRHEQVVGELWELVARHPLREGFHGQLMLALYRCGRQGEALAAYRRARDVLVAELGVEPGPGLRDLHQRMLAADPALAAAKVAKPGSASQPVSSPSGDSPAPRQLPAGIRHFTGRVAELGILTAALGTLASPDNGTPVILAISGTAGVGKTALAVHWAHQNADRFPDGQLCADLRGFDASGRPEDTATVVRGFLDALGVPPARVPEDVGAQLGLYRSLLAGKRMLILLDNARDSGQVRPLLSGAAGCLVLVTSRSQLTGLIALDGAVPLPVGLLTAAEARDLLARRLGAWRITREQPEASELIELCAGLPLALNIAAARAATHPATPFGELCTGLRDTSQRLEMLSAEPGGADVRAVFSWSYDALSTSAARLFRLAGIHPGPDIGLPAAASLAALDLGQAGRALKELTGANLVTEHAPGRYMLHDLLRVYAAEQALAQDGADERHAALGRVLDHYLHAAHAAALIFSPRSQPLRLADPATGVVGVPLPGREQARAWCQAEQGVLAAGVRCAASTGFATHAWQLAWSIESFPDQWRRWRDQATTAQIVLAAAKDADDLVGQAHAHRLVGNAFSIGGSPQQAFDHLQQGLALFDRLGDRVSQAGTELALGLVLLRLSEPTQALARSRHALHLFQRVGDYTGQAAALGHIGGGHIRLGQNELGLAACERALELARHADDPNIQYVRYAALESIGIIRHRLGQHGDAIASYQQALSILRSLGETWLTASPLDNLGDVYHATGDHDAARDSWKQAIAVLDDSQLPGADEIRQKLRDLGVQ
jgi:DNA-binding SARP family transcriptional activator/tetratricopeptide (TPR) repeat protein